MDKTSKRKVVDHASAEKLAEMEPTSTRSESKLWIVFTILTSRTSLSMRNRRRSIGFTEKDTSTALSATHRPTMMTSMKFHLDSKKRVRMISSFRRSSTEKTMPKATSECLKKDSSIDSHGDS